MSTLEAKNEALALLVEECGEAMQAAGKCLRHGIDHRNPTEKAAPTNREAVAREIGDLLVVIDLLIQTGICTRSEIECRRVEKLEYIGQWLHHIRVGGQR